MSPVNANGSFEVAVIGGGMVGAAVAFGLRSLGPKLALLDEGDVAHRTARGNFGLIWVQGKGAGLPHYATWTQRSAGELPRLAGTAEADVVIIGAGFTGLSAALHLREAGVDVAVVEAAEPGWGASGRNNGQVIPTLSRPDPEDIVAKHGAAGERFVAEWDQKREQPDRLSAVLYVHFRLSDAGRAAFLAGRIPVLPYASASSPAEGVVR